MSLNRQLFIFFPCSVMIFLYFYNFLFSYLELAQISSAATLPTAQGGTS